MSVGVRRFPSDRRRQANERRCRRSCESARIGSARAAVREPSGTPTSCWAREWMLIAGKTGYIDQAGYCLATLVQLEDERFVSIVVLGGPVALRALHRSPPARGLAVDPGQRSAHIGRRIAPQSVVTTPAGPRLVRHVPRIFSPVRPRAVPHLVDPDGGLRGAALRQDRRAGRCHRCAFWCARQVGARGDAGHPAVSGGRRGRTRKPPSGADDGGADVRRGTGRGRPWIPRADGVCRV